MQDTETAQQTAIREFLERKEKNSTIVRKNNADLYAGSPMYFYCQHCGAEDVKPEDYDPRSNPVKNPCDECKELIDQGLMPQQ